MTFMLMPFLHLWFSVCLCIHGCAHLCVWEHTYMCGCICVGYVHVWYGRVHACVCVCTHICMHANEHPHLYRYTYGSQRKTSGIAPDLSLDLDREPSLCCSLLRSTVLWASQVSSGFASHFFVGMLGFQLLPVILGFWGSELRSLYFHGKDTAL